ncbi:CesT family type III secretion system chaperone [Shewanella sp. SR44-3]|uniref:CesT family type III secretion system chaperone n=1 Tax=Shewanella sp. SR44-3 TaxID=2760936 RepID=UPI0015FE5D7F|nr:CesT family type III secretion system chaperone [Shewanella sp. SR44-3]MBB1268999.1 CesT family type III secretion system chaperone [Shewanella sp. SR44-3]
MNLELTNLMSALSTKLNKAPFMANDQGRYRLAFDDVSVEVYQSHEWLIVESDLQLELSSGLNYQQEAALEKAMQQALVQVRNSSAILAINDQDKLTLAQKESMNISHFGFIAMINHQVDAAEKYQQVIQQHTLASSNLNNVWLP